MRHLHFVMLALVLGCDKDPPAQPKTNASASASASASAVPTASTSAAPVPANPVLREEKTIEIDGVKETWRLEWLRPAAPTCMGDEGIASCPCAAFAFGEVGDLDLVRTKPGAPEERMHLSDLFDDRDAKLARWAPTAAERKAIKAPTATELQSRPVVTIMTFGDYDHDGRATEFVLPIGSGPCGHVQAVVIGIEKLNPKLHAFGSAEKPTEPIVLDRPGDWDKVKAKLPADLVQSPCGDHAAEVETHIVVTADAKGLHASTTTKKCM